MTNPINPETPEDQETRAALEQEAQAATTDFRTATAQNDESLGVKLGAYAAHVTKNAVIMAGVNGNSKVTRRIITDGVIGDETVISLIGLPSTGSITNVCPTGVGATDKFWYNNTAISPILYNADGTMVGQIPAALFTAGTTGTMKNFTYNEKEYLQVADSGFSRLIDITGKLPQDLTINDVVFSNLASVNNIYQDVDYRIGEDGSLSLYSFSEVNYISAMVTEAAPIA